MLAGNRPNDQNDDRWHLGRHLILGKEQFIWGWTFLAPAIRLIQFWPPLYWLDQPDSLVRLETCIIATRSPFVPEGPSAPLGHTLQECHVTLSLFSKNLLSLSSAAIQPGHFARVQAQKFAAPAVQLSNLSLGLSCPFQREPTQVEPFWAFLSTKMLMFL